MKALINKILSPFNIEVHGKGYLKKLSKGDYDLDEFAFQCDYFKNSSVSVIFDLGANNGDITQKYLDLFPFAKIHCFEPVDSCFSTLKSKFKGNPRVILNNFAISDEVGTSKLFINKNVDTSSLLESKEIGLGCDKNIKLIEVQEIQTTTIDHYSRLNDISSIDILKMDIQGGEYSAIKGAEDMLGSQKVKLLYFETYFQQQYRQQPLLFDIGKRLFEHEYFLQDLYSKIYGNNNLVWCDAIFLPKKEN